MGCGCIYTAGSAKGLYAVAVLPTVGATEGINAPEGPKGVATVRGDMEETKGMEGAGDVESAPRGDEEGNAVEVGTGGKGGSFLAVCGMFVGEILSLSRCSQKNKHAQYGKKCGV